MWSEIRKLPAFARRDLLVNWSYRASFVSDILNLALQILLFVFLDRLVDPSAIPGYGSGPTSYLAFVSIGIAFGAFLGLGLGQVATAIRNEQVLGTLEPLLMTPTRISTMQLGLAAYDFIYIPLRTAIFLGAVSLLLDVDFVQRGIPAGLLMLLVFIPFVWGLGLLGSAAVITFKRGGGGLGAISLIISITSGAYFPLEVLPGWIQAVARFNPVAAALEGSRQALLGGASIADVSFELILVAVSAAVALVLGSAAVSQAVRRERQRGTLLSY